MIDEEKDDESVPPHSVTEEPLSPVVVEEDEDIILVPSDSSTQELPSEESEPDEDEDIIDTMSVDEETALESDAENELEDSDGDSAMPTDEEEDDIPSEIEFDDTVIPFAGTPNEDLVDLLVGAEKRLSTKALDAEVRNIGSWANLLFRMRTDRSQEELRSQSALSKLTPEELSQLLQTGVDKNGNTVFTSSILRDENNKVRLRTARLAKKFDAGSVHSLTGQDAMLAFESQGKGGGYRIPLYNSGITIDVMVPTGTDVQTMLYNCAQVDSELGSRLGAHYFTYSDVMYKTQILNFLNPLIIGSSYAEWKKRDKLFSVIKINDLPAIIASIAAICHPEGYSDFAVTCKRPISPDPTVDACMHNELINVDIFKMIITRFSSMSDDSIEHMTQARMGSVRHNALAVAKYQSKLGFEGERITAGDFTFIMRIPSLTEHLESGAQYMADIINEIEGENLQGRDEQMGIRYIRTFLPWIGEIERKFENNSVVKTSDPKVILRALENAENNDINGTLTTAMEEFIGRSQLTYVGHPILPCTKCGYTAETPSGMWTFDPFSAFFTLAFQYLPQTPSTAATAG